MSDQISDTNQDPRGLSGRRGHDPQTLARRIGALRRSYRDLQRAHSSCGRDGELRLERLLRREADLKGELYAARVEITRLNRRSAESPRCDRATARWSDREFFAACLVAIAATRVYTGVSSVAEGLIVCSIEVAIALGLLWLRDRASARFFPVANSAELNELIAENIRLKERISRERISLGRLPDGDA